jgi:hypothetical protein
MAGSDLCVRGSIGLLAIVLLLLLGVPGCERVAEGDTNVRSDDYLAPQLRAAVEVLKRDVQGEPTSAANVIERALVTYDWVNAYALSGGYIPVEATALVARIVTRVAPGTAQFDDLDRLIQELATHDDRPGAIGTLTAETGPFEVARYTTFSQTYTVGSAPVETGGGFLVANHFQTGTPDYQATDPAAESYVTIRSSNPEVSFESGSFPVSGMHGGFRGPLDQLVFRVAVGTLQPGDTVTITYGDQSGGGPGVLIPDFVSDEMPYPIYVNLDGSDLWYSLPVQPIRVVAGSVAGVHGFAPTIVATGEPFDISVRAEDAFGNRARGDIPSWQLLLEGAVIREFPAGTDGIVIADGLRIDAPGVYRYGIRSADGHLQGAVNPVLVENDPAVRIYWGDTHGHSGFAEGVGTADAYMRFARDDARLDFITHSEHDLWMDDAEWETLRELVKQYNDEGRFVAYLGYEWTMQHQQGGHHNVLFRTPEGRSRLPIQHYPTLSQLYQGLREQYRVEDVVVIPHAHQKAEYRMSDPDLQPLVEIMSMHGTFEWFGRMYLSHGHQVGFIAASDDHIGRPGYATPRTTSLAQRGGLGAVFTSERTSDAIFDAMRDLRTYATTGDRMILNMSLNGVEMGQRAPYSEERVLKGRVIGTGPIESITVIKNDQEVWHREYGERGNTSGDTTLRVTFYSDSYPFHPLDNPRGWRHWRGTLTVEDATLKSAHMIDRANARTQHKERDPTTPNQVRFTTNTRGDLRSIDLVLEGASADTRIVLDLEDAVETGSGPPQMRRHQMIPGQRVSMRLGDMRDAELRHDVPFDGYDDQILLRAIHHDGPLEVEFEFVDDGRMRHGDYYFVRVRQADEATAWSSPIWVGGYPPR